MKRTELFRCIWILCLVCFLIVPLKANYLHNPNFEEGIDCWHGIGDPVYLKPNGSEGSKDDKGAQPALKIPLKRSVTRSVYQEFNTVDEPGHVHVRLEIRCSADFRRSADKSDYTKPWAAGSYHASRIPVVPQSDFWIRLDPGGLYRMSDANKSWHVVDATFKKSPAVRSHVLQLCVPCGMGSIYIRNVVVSK